MKNVTSQSKYGILEYRFERLPSKLKPWYRYASEFVRVTKLKTPRIIYANNLLKCSLMENDPLNSCEVEFTMPTAASDYGRGRKTQREVRFYYITGSDTVELVFKDPSAGIHLRSMTNQILRYEFNLHQEFDSIEPEMQFYVQEAMKAIKICEERNLELFKTLLNHDKSDFPVVIDERTQKKSKQ